MGNPDPSENLPDPEAWADPVGELGLRPLPHLVRKHRDRVVVLAASRCFSHCRFCFRRGRFNPDTGNGPTRDQWQAIFAWVEGHPEVEEVILSGGDPLTLGNDALARIASRLAAIPHLRRWRIHSRAPVVVPERVDAHLACSLQGPLPRRLILHLNHPAELREPVLEAVRRLRQDGVEVLCQSVLLAGVNDDPGILLELFRGLAGHGIQPHYLHHPDRAPGNARFRLSIRRGMEVWDGLRRQACRQKVAIPAYVLDLPNGAGKIPVADLESNGEQYHGPRTRTRYRWSRPVGWDALVAEKGCEWWDVWESCLTGSDSAPAGSRPDPSSPDTRAGVPG
jgi:lysine 2,3-aminomutase